MHDEASFRIALVVVILITMAIGIPHRMRAAASGERISHKDEGLLFAATLRIAGLLLWISTIAYLVFPTFIAWASIPVPSPMRWIAAIAAIACTSLFYCVLVQREMERRLIGVIPKSELEMVVLESLDPNAWIYRILANPEGKECANL